MNRFYLLFLLSLFGCAKQQAEPKAALYMNSVEFDHYVTAVAIGNEGSDVFCGTYDGLVYRVDRRSHNFVQEKQLGGPVYEILLLPHDTLYAVHNKGLANREGIPFLLPDSEKHEEYSPYSTIVVGDTVAFSATSNGVFRFELNKPGSEGQKLLCVKGDTDCKRFYSLWRTDDRIVVVGGSGVWSIGMDGKWEGEKPLIAKPALYLDPINEDQAFVVFQDGEYGLLNRNSPSLWTPSKRKVENAKVCFHDDAVSDPSSMRLLFLDAQNVYVNGKAIGYQSSGDVERRKHFAAKSEDGMVYVGLQNGLGFFRFDSDFSAHEDILSVCPDAQDGFAWGVSEDKNLFHINLRSHTASHVGSIATEQKVSELLGKTVSGLLYRGSNGAIYGFRNGKTKEIVSGEGLRGGHVVDKTSLILVYADAIQKYDLKTKRKETLVRQPDLNPKIVKCYDRSGTLEMLVSPVNGNVIHYSSGVANTLGISSEGIVDLALGTDFSKIYLLKSTQVESYSILGKPLGNYRVPEDFPPPTHIGTNTVRLVGYNSSNSLGGFLQWTLRDTLTPPRFLHESGTKVNSISSDRKGGVLLAHKGGVFYLHKDDGEAVNIPVFVPSEETSIHKWKRAFFGLLAVLVLGALLFLGWTVILGRKSQRDIRREKEELPEIKRPNYCGKYAALILNSISEKDRDQCKRILNDSKYIKALQLLEQIFNLVCTCRNHGDRGVGDDAFYEKQNQVYYGLVEQFYSSLQQIETGAASLLGSLYHSDKLKNRALAFLLFPILRPEEKQLGARLMLDKDAKTPKGFENARTSLLGKDQNDNYSLTKILARGESNPNLIYVIALALKPLIKSEKGSN